MKGKFEYSKKEGLPNGANEMETILKAFFEARMAPFFQPGGPVKPYKPKSQADYNYRTKMYEDSLGAYNEFKDALNYMSNKLSIDPSDILNLGDRIGYKYGTDEYYDEIEKQGLEEYEYLNNNVKADIIIPETNNRNWRLWKKPVQQILPYKPIPDKMSMRPMVTTPQILPSRGEIGKWNPKPLRTSPRGQTVLQYNPETGKHEMVERRVQQDAFWYDNHDGWQDNSQPVVYYDPETKEYSDKPFTSKNKDVAQNLKFKHGGPHVHTNAFFEGPNPNSDESNLSGGFNVSGDKFGASLYASTPYSKESRKYFKGLIEPSVSYRPNENLDINFSTTFSQDGLEPKLGLKYRFGQGGIPRKLVYKKGGIIEESYELDASDDAIEYYKSLGYKVEYVEGGPTQDFDKEEYGWQYKKEGDKYLTRRTGDTDWITAKGNALNAIKYDVYNETPEAVFDPTVVQSGSKQQQQTKQRGSYIKNLQKNLLDEGYYIGPTYDDGINGAYTQNALAAYEAGIPSEEYNKKFKKTSLQTNPDVKVPTALVERAQGIERPKSPKLSANAALSLEESEEDTKEQPEQNLKGLLPGTQKKLTEGAQEKGARTESEEYNYIPVLDPDNLDEAYSHLDDFLIDWGKAWQSKDKNKTNTRFSEIHNNAGSCLKGAKMCNAEFVADKVGANSIAGLFNEIHQIKGSSTFDEGLPWGISADQTKYSVPSRGGNVGQAKTGEFKDTKGFDAWEAADALIGEGLGTELYSTSVDDKAWLQRSPEFVAENKGMTQDFYDNYVKKGRIPLGALIFEGNAAGNYTDPKYGERARHAMTVIGFDKEDGMPLIYDSGQIRRINNRQFDMPITRVVIPKGYENYTLENLKKGQAIRYEQLGYDKEPDKVEYKNNDELKPYVNTVLKGMHQHAYKIANDYNMDKDIMDKMQNRVVGLAEVESNFNNEGDRDLNWKRDLKIATEGYLQDGVKYVWKWGEDVFNDESDVKGYHDWEVEKEALANLKKQGVNPFAPGTTKTESGKTRNLLQEEMNKMRASGNYPRWDKDLDQPGRSGEYESSVGPLQIKKLPLYVERELGIDKSDLYGSTVGDNKELENSSAAALVHLVESYKRLEKKYNQEMDMNLTEDQLIDLATVAYNNASKANSEEFVKNYILNKELKDNYLTQVHAGEATYTNTPDKYAQEVAQFRAKYNVAPSKDVYDRDLIARAKAQANDQEPLAPLKPSEQQTIANNVEEEEEVSPLAHLYNRNRLAEITSGVYGDEQPLAPLRPYITTTFKDGGEVQDIYDYLNNKLRHR